MLLPSVSPVTVVPTFVGKAGKRLTKSKPLPKSEVAMAERLSSWVFNAPIHVVPAVLAPPPSHVLPVVLASLPVTGYGPVRAIGILLVLSQSIMCSCF